MEKEDIYCPLNSARSFINGEIPPESVQQILRGALLTAYGSARNTMELYITDEKPLLERLSDVREGAEILKYCSLAIIVVADRLYDGSWIENSLASVWAICSKASELGVAYAPLQIRGYSLSDGTLSDEMVRGIMEIPEGKTVCSIVALGYSEIESYKVEDDELDWERVHIK